MTDLIALKRELEHLAVLTEIKSKKDDEDRKRKLILLLLFLLDTLYEDNDYTAFKIAFLQALRNAMEAYAEQFDGDFSELIDLEIATQSGYLSGLIKDLRNGTISQKMAEWRVGLYAKTLDKFAEQVYLDMQGETSLKWVYSHTVVDHCNDCINLNGTIRTAREWLRTIYPRSGQTECMMSCQCELLPV